MQRPVTPLAPTHRPPPPPPRPATPRSAGLTPRAPPRASYSPPFSRRWAAWQPWRPRGGAAQRTGEAARLLPPAPDTPALPAQFYVRLSAPGSRRDVRLEDVQVGRGARSARGCPRARWTSCGPAPSPPQPQLQYYFDGPDASLNPNRPSEPADAAAPPPTAEAFTGAGDSATAGAPAGAEPALPFRLTCSDTSPGLREWRGPGRVVGELCQHGRRSTACMGPAHQPTRSSRCLPCLSAPEGRCDAVLGEFRRGLAGVRGAQYFVAVRFRPGVGRLAGNGSGNGSDGHGGSGSSGVMVVEGPPGPPPAPPGPLLSAVELILSIGGKAVEGCRGQRRAGGGGLGGVLECIARPCPARAVRRAAHRRATPPWAHRAAGAVRAAGCAKGLQVGAGRGQEGVAAGASASACLPS
jgi:hypothetical protein